MTKPAQNRGLSMAEGDSVICCHGDTCSSSLFLPLPQGEELLPGLTPPHVLLRHESTCFHLSTCGWPHVQDTGQAWISKVAFLICVLMSEVWNVICRSEKCIWGPSGTNAGQGDFQDETALAQGGAHTWREDSPLRRTCEAVTKCPRIPAPRKRSGALHGGRTRAPRASPGAWSLSMGGSYVGVEKANGTLCLLCQIISEELCRTPWCPGV